MGNKEIDPKVSEYMASIGRLGGEKMKKRGSEHMKWVRSHGKKKKENNEQSSGK